MPESRRYQLQNESANRLIGELLDEAGVPDDRRGYYQQLLTTVLKEATWKDGGLRTTLLEPFEQLRRSNRATSTNVKGNGGSGQRFEDWLPGMDSNHDSRLQRPLSYH